MRKETRDHQELQVHPEPEDLQEKTELKEIWSVSVLLFRLESLYRHVKKICFSLGLQGPIGFPGDAGAPGEPGVNVSVYLCDVVYMMSDE